MEDYNKNVHKKWYFKWWGIISIFFAIIILSTITGFGFLILNLKINPITEQTNPGSTTPEDIDHSQDSLIYGDGNNYWFGAAKPKVTIVEFGDFTCAHCKNAFPTIREIGLKYKKDVKVIFRNFPIISDNSADYALAGACVGEQGLFWPMYDKMYLNQGVAVDQVGELARQIGTDMTRYNNCVNSKKYEAKLQKDLDDGNALNITGTPTWFINGERVEGDIPYDTFIKMIDNLIKNN